MNNMLILKSRKHRSWWLSALLILLLYSCVPTKEIRKANASLPNNFQNEVVKDSINSAAMNWKQFFADPNLQALIDTALVNNQEFNIAMQQVAMARNEIRARKGEYLPFVNLQAGAELEKVGRYTSQGANDANTDIKPEVEFPEPLPNYKAGLFASWELDVWKKLRNSKKAAVMEK
ncbi:hypothetical protein LCGC14_3142260, partial [marine sediment metagenome]